MLAYAYQYLTNVPDELLRPLLTAFNKTAIEIFEGQQMDVDFETRNDVALEEYLKMVEFKTSVLLACCVQLGAIVGKASIEDQLAIYDFGLNLGLSFQIKDDLLDAFGEAEKVGKRIGGDILQNKKTYLFISTTQLCSAAQQAELPRLIAETDEQKKIDGIKVLMEVTGAKAATEQKAEDLYQSALASLQKVNVPAERKAYLAAIAEKIKNRDY
jgi:geranylgeranyl diphosphate synthase type II